MLDLVERQKRSTCSAYEIQLGISIGSSHEIFSFVGDSLNGTMPAVPKIRVCALLLTEPSLDRHLGSVYRLLGFFHYILLTFG